MWQAYWAALPDILLDALLDALKALPFLFLAYLLIEFLEHKAEEKFTDSLRHIGPWGPLLGSVLGAVPQCGFSVTASNFYAGRLISLGTLLAVFLSTSDEAVIILFSQPDAWLSVLKLLGVKLVIGFSVGFLVDLLHKKKEEEAPFEDLCKDCHCDEHSVLHSALHHTVQIFLFLLIVNFVLGSLFNLIGEEALSRFLLQGSFLQPILCALFGFIPNCAASVVLTKLYLAGSLSFGATVAGLSTGAGLGLAVLFRTNKKPRENLMIMLIMFLSSAAFGLLLQVIGL